MIGPPAEGEMWPTRRLVYLEQLTKWIINPHPLVGPGAALHNNKSVHRYATVFSFISTALLLIAYWMAFVWKDYFPINDDFAVMVHSTHPFHPRVSEWFVQGYAKYFLAFPEWSKSTSVFLRPVANGFFYLSSLLFERHWACYLMTTYVIQSCLVALTVFFASHQLRLPIRSALVAGLLVFLSPAFFSEAFFSPAFCLDLLAAVFVIAALISLVRRRFCTVLGMPPLGRLYEGNDVCCLFSGSSAGDFGKRTAGEAATKNLGRVRLVKSGVDLCGDSTFHLSG